MLHTNDITSYHFCTSSDLLVGVEEQYHEALSSELEALSDLCAMSSQELTLEIPKLLLKLGISEKEQKEMWAPIYRNIEARKTPPVSDEEEFITGKVLTEK